MNVLAISYGRNLFAAGNSERARMLECAKVVSSFHIIVFARTSDKFTLVKDGNLYLYPTGGRTKLGMLIKGFILGRKILKQQSAKDFIITTQDPFEAGLVGFLLARLFSVPLNIQEHGDFFTNKYWRQETFLNRFRFYLGKFLLQRADSVRVVSDRIRKTLVSLGITNKIISQLSVVVPLQSFLTALESNMSRKLFSTDSIIVLSVARFVPQKNLALLIDAFAQAYKSEPRLKLLLIGRGSEQAKLEEKVDKLFPENTKIKIVEFIPWSNDIPSYMKSVDIYALSSNYEGYARVLPEAMAAGLPIVTTDVGCVGEICLAGRHCLVAEKHETDSFAQALLKLAESPTLGRSLGEAGRLEMIKTLDSQTDYAKAWRATLVS